MDLKDTLLIGKTDFEMKANLNTKEPKLQSQWEVEKVYEQKLKFVDINNKFILHDGPPYANGNIHVGHALNKILKDFIVRWKMSNNFYSEYILGWDTHGLPIESAISKTKTLPKECDVIKFRELCKEYALQQVENQKKQFKRLGIFTNYNKYYLTLNHDYEITELRVFQRMVEKGLIYRDFKPVYWSPISQTALAEAEIEYKDIKSPSIYVSIKLIDGKYKNDHVIIWTTTPWTIPSNQLIAISEKLKYVRVQLNDQIYIVAENLVEKIAKKINFENYEILQVINNNDLINSQYKHPWYDNKIGKIVFGHHVTDEAGTGLVHIAGGFGEDDFQIVKENKIKPFVPIDNQGKFTTEIEDDRLENIFYEDANKIVGQTLKEKNNLLKLEFVKHAYPHDWRSKTPIIYRATYQWFVSINPIKKQIEDIIEKNVITRPIWSKERLKNIIKDRVDWTISRQRLWGVPIIAFYDKNNQVILNKEVVKYAIDVLQQKGVNSWFKLPADEFLPKKYQNQNIRKEIDILDVWFDSGVSNIVMSECYNLKPPFDVYLEGNDQYRGWFNSSTINSVIYDQKSAFKNLLTHGMTNDEHGKKMSKSIGNTIDPLKICDSLGADVLRLWVASTDYTDDQRIGDNILKQISESYRKIRNTLRFLLANLFDFDPNKDYCDQFADVDRFALYNLTKTKNEICQSYDNFKFNNVYRLINNYVINDLSSFYLDFVKDILYVEPKNSLRRRQVQSVLYEQLWMLIDVLRPIIPHTIEEVYNNFNYKKDCSIHLLNICKQQFKEDIKFVELWNKVLILKNSVNCAIEEAKQKNILKKSFEAIVKINLSEEFKQLENISDLSQILIVNKIEFINDNFEYNDKYCSINITKKQGNKCQRCWVIFDKLYNDLCKRCFEIVGEFYG